MAIEIGQQAPDFALKNPANEVVKLSDLQGTPVLLVFYPFAFSPVCTGELCQIRDDFSMFTDAGVTVFGISCDGRHSQRVWTEQEGFEFVLLSDFWPHGAAAQAYGIFNDAVGCAMRSTFLINAEGVVVDRFGTDEIGTAREHGLYKEALAKL